MKSPKKKGSIFIVSAPSGTGKTTVVEELVKKYPDEMARVLTCTTREPRKGEVDGKDYRFLTRKVFDEKVAKGDFLEHQEIFGYHYGTLSADLQNTIDAGKHAFLVIDVQGAVALLKKVEATTIFIMPPSFEELERRIRLRGKDEEKEIAIRLAQAKSEIEQGKRYDYIVTNDKIEKVVYTIRSIVIGMNRTAKRRSLT